MRVPLVHMLSLTCTGTPVRGSASPSAMRRSACRSLLKRLGRCHRHERADAAVDLVDTVEYGAGQLAGRNLASIQEDLRGVRGEPDDIGRVHVRP